MLHDLVKAEYLGGYRIILTFDDGKNGIVDFAQFIDKGGVFGKLKTPEYFKNFKINKELGVITWDDQIDIAPEVLYSKATNSPLPEWMEN
jgi:hypothetical protein